MSALHLSSRRPLSSPSKETTATKEEEGHLSGTSCLVALHLQASHKNVRPKDNFPTMLAFRFALWPTAQTVQTLSVRHDRVKLACTPSLIVFRFEVKLKKHASVVACV